MPLPSLKSAKGGKSSRSESRKPRRGGAGRDGPRPSAIPPLPCVEGFGYWGARKQLPTLPFHTNPGLEIVLITKGEFTWQVEDRIEPIHPGTVFFTLPHQRHGAREKLHPGAELYFLIIRPDSLKPAFRLHRDLGLAAAENRWISKTLSQTHVHAFPASPLLRALLPAIFHELQRQSRGRLAVVTGLLRAAVIELARIVAANPGLPAPKPDSAATVRQFIRDLERRHEEAWTLDAMAKACRLKRTQFAAHFTKLTGDTPVTHLNRLRVRRAEHLLETTEQTVTEVAFACGFQSSQYFATVFRQFTGACPTARRKS
jgi:AraC family transcriptional regulator, L-rhamnose operon regulatory protein RhaS